MESSTNNPSRFLELGHTVLLGIWSYFDSLTFWKVYSLSVTYYGQPEHIAEPPATFALTVLLGQTICFMVQFGELSILRDRFDWIVAGALGLGTAVDVLMTVTCVTDCGAYGTLHSTGSPVWWTVFYLMQASRLSPHAHLVWRKALLKRYSVSRTQCWSHLMDGSASQLCRTPHSLNLLLVMVKEDWTATHLVGIGYGTKNFTILG
ncbi:hypothetical protein B0H13DRAFT_1898065 [Mycena leptocephala]|nr:hypothetical protein B0H13DRAFT_1898065 [Mycena leptocephala]